MMLILAIFFKRLKHKNILAIEYIIRANQSPSIFLSLHLSTEDSVKANLSLQIQRELPDSAARASVMQRLRRKSIKRERETGPISHGLAQRDPGVQAKLPSRTAADSPASCNRILQPPIVNSHQTATKPTHCCHITLILSAP